MMGKKVQVVFLGFFLIFGFSQISFAQETLVNINTASSEELQTLNGIGPVKAQAIIDYRNANGPFQNIEDINNVRGIGDVTYANIKDFITVGELEPAVPTVSISGVISSDTTWSPKEGTYILENAVTVSASTTLTISPGTVIKSRHGGAGALVVEGSLVALGTLEDKIYFTSMIDDDVGGESDELGASTGSAGDWRGIYFQNGSTGDLEHVVLRYAGYGPGSSYGHFVGIENDGGDLSIRNSNIHDNYKIISNGGGGLATSGRGIYNRRGSLSVNNSVISNNFFGIDIESGTSTISDTVFQNHNDSTGYGVGYGLYVSGEDPITLVGNTFVDNTKTAFINAGATFSHSGNTSLDVLNRGFEIGGSITGQATWETDDLPLVIANSNILWVEEGATLAINPGSIIKFGTGARMIVKGSLISRGAETSKIYLTSLKDDSVGGDTNGDDAATVAASMDWSGVEFWENATGDMSHTVARYTGAFSGLSRAAVFNFGGNLLLDNVTFSNNSLNDFYQTMGSSTISHTLFTSDISAAVNNTGAGTVDARRNWWGVNTGPSHSTNATGTGLAISGNVLYDPWIRRDPALPNPVIIVPGIMGSRLNNSVNSEVWPAGLLLISPLDLHLNQLSLTENGNDQSDIEVGDLIDSIGDSNFFTGLIENLELNGYQENVDLFTFPYDWRLDISEISYFLNQKIEEIKLQTGTEKIDVIAHSMGGLITKKYLGVYSNSGVNKFIDLGTPHQGSPKSFKILNYGDNLDATFFFNLIGLNSNRVKIISQNMPSVYQLLPSENYFDESDPNYRYYVFNGINGNDRLSYTETTEYMKAEGRNGLLLDKAQEFHEGIANLDPTDYGVETYNIVGCGTPTIGQFYILGKEEDETIYNIKMINGDGTVPLRSAEAMSASQTYYVKNANHAVMPSTSGVKELVASILTGDDFSVSSHSNLATNSNDCQIPDGKLVSFHSPIELHVYDESGNHVGPDENGDIENEIPGVAYEVIEGNKFAFLPGGVQYNIQGSATDVGTFDTRIQEIVDGEVVTTSIFSDLPLTPTTSANFDIGSSVPSIIYLDHDGDNVFESNYSVSTTTEGILESLGKMPSVPDVVVETATSRSPQFKKSEEAVSLPINSDVVAVNLDLIPTEITQTISVASSISPEGVLENQEFEMQQKEEQYRSVASVYKALGYKLINFFKSIWSWFISRL